MNNSNVRFSRWEQEIIALAAVSQCASVVNTLATQGQSNPEDITACINPLFVINPSSFDDIYPNLSHLSLGFRTVQDLFGSSKPSNNSAVIKYALSLIQLQSSLMREKPLQKTIQQKLTTMTALETNNSWGHDETEDSEANQSIFNQLAALYQDTISTLPYRIQVQGKAEHLKDNLTASKIRAVLLAGIRSAVLWNQLGGRKWRLIIYRKRIHSTAADIRRKLLRPIH